MLRSHSTTRADLRVRLEAARLDLLTLFRPLDTMNLSPREIRSDSSASFLNLTPIMWRQSGLWINLLAV